MTTSYQDFSLLETAETVTPQRNVNWAALSASCVSFYGWLYRWHEETADVSPSTPYLARKQRRTERTIYRWLAELEAVGLIRREVLQGVERSIIPLLPPPPKRRRSPINSHPAARFRAAPALVVSGAADTTMSGECQGVSYIDSLRRDTSTQTGVVASLVAEGVFPNVAAQLVAELGEESVQKQLDALPHRKAKDRAAVLVASVKQSWPLPVAFTQAVERNRKAALEASQRAARAALESKRVEQRSQVSTVFQSLPEEARSVFLSEACEALRKEQPDAFRMMYGRAGFDAWVTGRAVKLVAARGLQDV